LVVLALPMMHTGGNRRMVSLNSGFERLYVHLIALVHRICASISYPDPLLDSLSLLLCVLEAYTVIGRSAATPSAAHQTPPRHCAPPKPYEVRHRAAAHQMRWYRVEKPNISCNPDHRELHNPPHVV
jgi:hypothetical protein